MLLDPGFNLNLRPMHYAQFFDMYRDAIKNTWTVEEIDLGTDIADLKKLTTAEQHLIKRLVAFFATGDSVVANNVVLNLYKHINSPEARLYLSRQLFEEALHVQFYLTLLDTYLPDEEERVEAFKAVDNIPSIKQKADFCLKYMDTTKNYNELTNEKEKKQFLLNLICFASCVEGLFFFAAFAYVYFLRSKGLLHGLASGTNWVFRDESCHMEFAFEVIKTIKAEQPELFDDELRTSVHNMMDEAIECEMQFAEDALQFGITGMSRKDMRSYLEFCADQRLVALGFTPIYKSENPFQFMELQDVQELTNFFERRVSAYQVGIEGTVSFNEDF
jgi:ribonucleoside-diphosphate reductase beta chain